tara:strand:+ start:357 stop:1004 length:648 start_codon:yes stop_codon:yes gene_type:complete
MPDYSKSKIYKIVCNETGQTYYGSTTVLLSQRIGKHRLYNSCSSRCIIERGNYDYSLIEEFPCESKEQLHKRERWYIENNDCVNVRVEGRTQKEYQNANKEKIQERKKQYYQANKEKIQEYYQANKEQTKQYYQANKEKIQEYYQANKEQTKQYYQANKEKIQEYREANKEKIKEKKRIYRRQRKKTCECGCEVSADHYPRHRRSIKHELLMNAS